MTLYNLICSNCGAPHEREGQRYCAACHAGYQARYRKNQTRQRREISRLMARQARDDGTIERKSCQVCGSPVAEMHHPDHEMEHFVFWLCRDHHMAWHAHWKHTVLNIFGEWLEVARACAAVRKSEDAVPAVVEQKSKIRAGAVRAA